MGQEAEGRPPTETGVTQAANKFMGDWQARLTDNLAVLGLGTAVSGVSVLAGGQVTIYALQEGDVLRAVGVGIVTLAAAGVGIFTGKKAWGIAHQLEESE